jgi:hypothetical protein
LWSCESVRVTLQVVTVLGERTASIFRVEMWAKEKFSSETLVTTHKIARCHNPEDQYRYVHCRENLRLSDDCLDFIPIHDVTLSLPTLSILLTYQLCFKLILHFLQVLYTFHKEVGLIVFRTTQLTTKFKQCN